MRWHVLDDLIEKTLYFTPLSSQIFSECYSTVMPYACRRIFRISTCLRISYDIGSRRWSL